MRLKSIFPVACFILLSLATSGQNKLDSLYDYGLRAMQDFQFQQALDHFFECQRNDPFNTEYLSKVGYCYYQLGNLQEARTYFSEILKKDTFHIQSLNYLATIEEEMLDYRAALSRVNTLIAIDSTNGNYFRLAGNLSGYLFEKEAAMLYYYQAIGLNPADQNALISFCKLLADGGYLLDADSLLDRALQKQPKNLRLLYESAKTNYLLRQYEEVIPQFEKVLSMGDTNLIYLPLLPYSLAQSEQCEEAIPWLEYIDDRKEPNEQLYYFLGFCYNKIDSIEKSLDNYQLAIAEGLSPNLGVYYQHLGDINSNQELHRLSLKHYELALNYGNNDPVIYFHMAVAFDHIYKKDKKKALEYYKSYLDNQDGENPEFIKYAQTRVEKIDYYEKHIWKGN